MEALIIKPSGDNKEYQLLISNMSRKEIRVIMKRLDLWDFQKMENSLLKWDKASISKTGGKE